MNYKQAQKGQEKSLTANVVEFFLLLIAVFLIRTYGFGLYQVPSGSMETTMLVGERFFADKLSYNFRSPERGEVIAMNDPLFVYSSNTAKALFERYVWGPANWTKRIIGKPGDEVMGVVEDGKPVVYLNGQKLDEPYLNKYPLIYVFPENPESMRATAQKEIEELMRSDVQMRFAALSMNELIQHRMIEHALPQSYDESKSYDDQPYYQMFANRVIRDQEGNPIITHQGVGKKARSQSAEEKIAAHENYWDGSDEFYVKLGADEYWGMGDNRAGSKDCRFFGPVKQREIHGRIIFRIWSIASYESWWIVDLIKHPIDFFHRVRWHRFFQLVR